ncbi:MAG: isochorismatase family protein [Gammaproteobacteria bacterium]|nr:isochorismatase family protein [Gammaproteobacteria bacterium]
MNTHDSSPPSRHKALQPATGDALILVDVQVDFLPGGALGVPEAEGLIETLNGYIARFRAAGLPIVATRDWHPSDHCSFAAQGGPWPVHCVRDSAGARFANDLRLPDDAIVIDKATSQDRDAYSGFQQTDLATMLRARDVRRVFVAGLATDYCVIATVRDALESGFEVVLLEDGIRAVNVQAGDGERAIEDMHQRGAQGLCLKDLAA